MSQIKKCLFPAAGYGTRFLPATKAIPKEMLPILTKPLLQYGVEEAREAGCETMAIVTGRGKRAIEDHFDRNLELERALEEKGKKELLKLVKEISDLVDIVYVRQKEPLGLGHAILTAEPAVGNEPFAVLLGDDIMVSEPPAIKQLIDVFNKYRCCVLGIQEVPREEVSKYGIIAGREIEKGVYKVDTLIEKPSVEEAPSNLAITGRYILTPGIFNALRNIPPGRGGEIQLTDGIQKLGLREAIYAKIMEGKRYDTGTKVGFLEATVDFALSREDLKEPFLRFLKKRVKEELKDGGNDESDS